MHAAQRRLALSLLSSHWLGTQQPQASQPFVEQSFETESATWHHAQLQVQVLAQEQEEDSTQLALIDDLLAAIGERVQSLLHKSALADDLLNWRHSFMAQGENFEVASVRSLAWCPR